MKYGPGSASIILGYLWAVIVPLLFIMTLAFVYAALGRRAAHGASVELLLLSGMMAWLTFTDTQNQASRAYQTNRQLVVYPMVSVVDIVIARALLELGTKLAVMTIFMQQIERSQAITLTHNEMTRFMMTLEEASGLVIDSIRYASGGENFITKMPVMRIRDLAEVMIDMMAPYYGRDPRDTEIKIVGIRPGEKLYEELSTAEELARMWDCGRYFVVDPLNVVGERTYPSDNPQPTDRMYISSTEPAMSHEGIRSFIEAANVLPTDYKPAPTPRVALG